MEFQPETKKTAFLEDTRLSWKAKGLLAYLLSLPCEPSPTLKALVTKSTDGKASVSAGRKELEETGYLYRIQIRDDGKFSNFEWLVFHEPKPREEIERWNQVFH